ncbi:hypothetical protein Q5P01_001320 [Channa striata]|uniref:Uncharacterized protein n=1 Tax=Channa striata TaxID=64152 RepID=A0AA88NKQ9_CHASR|nr:hypothetical protein Q5P01_001320 [Channa striata]
MLRELPASIWPEQPITLQLQTKEWHAAISCVSSITNEVRGEREKRRERGKEAACMSTLRQRQRGSREASDGRVENGGDGVQEEGEEGEEEGCSAAVERSERRLQSPLMGEMRLCYHSSEELEPKQQ